MEKGFDNLGFSCTLIMLHEINLNLDVVFCISISQNSNIKLLSHFCCLKHLSSFFCPQQEQLPLQAVKSLFLIKATHLSDIIIQVTKWPSSKKRNWRHNILVIKRWKRGRKKGKKKPQWVIKQDSNKELFLPLHFKRQISYLYNHTPW